MTADALSLDLAHVPLRWRQFYMEAASAVGSLEPSDLKVWCQESLGEALRRNKGRVSQVLNLLKKAIKGAWTEFLNLLRALYNRNLTSYIVGRARRIFDALKSSGQSLKSTISELWSVTRRAFSGSSSSRIDFVIKLIAGVIGFIVIGGRGDGGVVDLDIAFGGIGSHRSIFTHSLLVGVLFEFIAIAVFQLFEILYNHLPAKHLSVWDRMIQISRQTRDGLIGGAYLGLASHLAIDSHFGGWTPYKDLPFSAPSWVHHVVMDLNAAGSGFFAWRYNRMKRWFKNPWKQVQFSPA